ncbi:DDE_3 domain-containing protein [Trichonephila clavipes]|uniref:DDE_3 domain-containing protein n=1 Tax=Trichonephila clavipes TaxID=2585209 RepID=A0A8X6W0B3_TRICX|nr:DDE_3 domain-containing protein [Trichonephila clavipes]
MINGRTRLHVVANGTMTGQRYIDEVLLSHVRLFRGAVGDKFVFMDDNATCHRTLTVQDCLDSEGIQRLVWLARSPDLNPIENVWDALGRQVAGRNYPPTNKNTLIRALTEEWEKLPQQLLDNVVQSMNVSRPSNDDMIFRSLDKRRSPKDALVVHRHGKEALTNKSILRGYNQFKKTICLYKKERNSGRSSVSEAVQKVRQCFVQSPLNSMRDATCKVWMPQKTDLGSNPEECMNVCKCIVSSRHRGILNSRRAASSLVRLVEEEDARPQTILGVFSLKIGEETNQSQLSPARCSSLRLTTDVQSSLLP